MLTMIGYWDDEVGKQKFIHPQKIVDLNWEVGNRSKIVSYLRAGIRINEELGCSFCRFPDGPPDSEMGNADLTDGTWIWPEGLPIYVERYLIRLPDEFTEHIKSNHFQIPSELDAKRLIQEPLDVSFWRQWCRTQKRKHLLEMIKGWFEKIMKD